MVTSAPTKQGYTSIFPLSDFHSSQGASKKRTKPWHLRDHKNSVKISWALVSFIIIILLLLFHYYNYYYHAVVIIIINYEQIWAVVNLVTVIITIIIIHIIFIINIMIIIINIIIIIIIILSYHYHISYYMSSLHNLKVYKRKPYFKI